MKSLLSCRKINLLLTIILCSFTIVYAVPADFFGTATDVGETNFRAAINTATSDSAEFFEHHFTSYTTVSALTPVAVTGTNGNTIYVRVSRGTPFNGFISSSFHSHDGNNKYYMHGWSVNASSWNECVEEGVKFEFFSDVGMTTPTTINAIGTFTNDWGTCCTSNNNTPTGTASGTALYAVFTTADASTATHQIGNIPSRISSDVHFVAEIDDSDAFTSVTLIPNGNGEYFAMGGYLLFSQVAVGSIPPGTGWTPSVPPSVAFNPANSATGIGVGSNITLTFTEAIRHTDNSDITDSTVDGLISLINRTGGEAAFNISFDATINSTKTVITINPSSDFASEQRVEVGIGATVEDQDDNAVTASSATFTCAAGGVPTAIINPTDGETDVLTGANITITFDEAVRNTDESDITDSNVDALITLKKTNSSGAVIGFDATINSDKTVITINPTVDFSPNQAVYVEILAVKDVDADPPNTTTASNVTFITSANTIPIVSDIPSQTIAEDNSFATIALDNYVIDAATTDALINWVATGQSLLTVTITNRVATIVAPENFNGSETITFKATDNDTVHPMFASDAATFTATPVNDAPVFSSLEITTANEDAAYNYTVSALDVDGDALTFAATTLPTLPSSWLTFSAPATISGTPSVAGSHAIVLTVTDGIISTPIEQSFTITVVNVNDAPVLTSTASTTASEDVAYSYTMAASDEEGDALTFAATTLPSWLTFSTPATISGTPDQDDIGSHSVVLTVSDPYVTVNQSFTIIVANVNDVPVFTSTTSTAATEDVAYSYTATASDEDGDALTFAATTLPSWLIFSSPATISGTPLNEHVGSNTVVLTVTDGIISTLIEQSFTITVVNVNDAPVFTNTASTTAAEDAVYSYTMAGSDVDVGDALTFAALTLPSWLTFSAPATISGTPDQDDIGTHSVVLTVSDAHVTVNQSLTITVVNTNDAPIFTSSASTISATENVAYSYTATATDEEGDALTFAATTLPSWLTFSAPATISGTPSVSGSFAVLLTVTDGIISTPIEQSFNIIVANVNDAPVFTSTASTAATEDVAYSYTATATDEDGDALTFAAPTLPSWLSFNVATQVLSGTPLDDHGGTHSVVLTVSDTYVTVNQSFTITVTLVNDAPVITSTAPANASADVLYSYSAQVSDPDDANNGSGVLTYSLMRAPSGMSVSNLGVITWTPARGILTSGVVTLTVADGGEDSAAAATETFTLTVEQTNRPPVFVIPTTADSSATEDAVYSYTMEASDPDGDAYTFAAPTLPSWLTFSAPATISGTPLNEHVGAHAVVLTVSDGTVAVEQTLTITVANTNDAPEFTSTTIIKAIEDVVYSYTMAGSDVDVGAALTFAATTLPSWLTLSAPATISGAPLNEHVGSHTVVLTVTDGIISTPIDTSFTITVINVNDAPVFSSTTITSATEDAVYSYTMAASDIDVGDALTFAATTLPSWLTFSAPATISGIPLNEHVGSGSSNNVVLTVSDGTVTVLQSFTITVINTNDPPVFTSIPITSVSEDAAYSYTVIAPDADPGAAALTFAATTLPSWLSFDVATQILSGTPLDAHVGTHSIVLTASDGTETVTQSFTITIENTNDLPLFPSVPATMPPTDATEDAAYTYTATASDDDDDALIFAAPTLPYWLTFSSPSTISGTPLNEHVGTHAVLMTVSDAFGAVEQSFAITVINTNDAPVFTSTTLTNSIEDAVYSYTATASDEDGNTLTFAAPTLPSWLNFDVATQVLSGTPLNEHVGTHAVVLSASDGTETVTQSLDIAVANTNDPPSQFELLYPVSVGGETIGLSEHNIEFNWQKSEDIDGDSLYYIFYIKNDNSLFHSDSLYDENSYIMNANDLKNIFLPTDEILTLEWYVACTDNMNTIISDSTNFYITILDLGIDEFVLPNEYHLLNPYPNPFNPVTVIEYIVPEVGHISISIYDIRGREVAKLYNGNQLPGYYMASWNASEFSSGLYFVKMVASGNPESSISSYVNTKKLILMK